MAIAAEYGVSDVTFDDRWLEVDYGDFDGSPLADVPHEVWQHWRSDIRPGRRPTVSRSPRSACACGPRARN